jgi:hypothetical protein
MPVDNGCMVPGRRRIAPLLVASAAAALAGGTAVLVASCSTQEVMKTTEIRRFTLAFIVSDGAW